MPVLHPTPHPATPHLARHRRDQCPGVFRPWPADDGGLVRIRLVGGRIGSRALNALAAVAAEHGDGDLHLTGRANLQLRGLPLDGDLLPDAVVEALLGTGLVPSGPHDLVRNVLVSPQSGLAGGRADLRPVAWHLDGLVCAAPRLAELPGRFLVVLDDGRGDLVGRPTDLGLVALDARAGQLRIGSTGWGDVVALDDAADRIVALMHAFLDARGDGEDAAWHVDELSTPWVSLSVRDPRTHVGAAPLAFGAVPGGTHVEAPDGVLSPGLVAELTARTATLVITPWRGVLVAEDAR